MCMAAGPEAPCNTTHIRLAVADCLREPDPNKRRLEAIVARLWREPATHVIEAYDAMIFGGLDILREAGERNGILAARMRTLRRPLPRRDRPGMQLAEIAAHVGCDRETLARLMQRHDLLELVPFGGRQSRRLVTNRAFNAGMGHNADPGGLRSVRLDGHARAAVFPVFYVDAVPGIVKLIGWDAIQAEAAGITSKRVRLQWALATHADLPDLALAGLAGCSLRTVERAREKGRPAASSPELWEQ